MDNSFMDGLDTMFITIAVTCVIIGIIAGAVGMALLLWIF